MMVRDEETTIERTIRAARPWITSWCIVDTGSVDRTLQVATEALEDLPGKATQIPWPGHYGRARNAALNIASDGYDGYLCMLDGGDVILGQPTPMYCPGYSVEMTDGEGWVWRSTRIFRAGTYHYVGAVHEAAIGPEPLPLPCRVQCSPPSRPARWARDAKTLAKRRDPRGTLYYALSLLWSGQDATAAFERRLTMGGWDQEIFESLMRLGRYEEARERWPTRAEPYLRLAQSYAGRDWDKCFYWAGLGAECTTKPRDFLFWYEPARAECQLLLDVAEGHRELGRTADTT